MIIKECKEYGEFILCCDMCGKRVEGFKSFQDAIDYKIKENWETCKIGSDWEDYCPICSEDIY